MAGKNKKKDAVAAREPRKPGPIDHERADSTAVLLRFTDRNAVALPIALPAEVIENAVGEWRYRLRDRRRWSTRESSVNKLGEIAAELARDLGIAADLLREVGNARLVQVDLPAGEDRMSRALRALPWEYLLAATTRIMRRDKPFAVVRRLRVPSTGRQWADDPEQWLMVQSAPGSLHDQYEFESECAILERSATASGAEFASIEDPTVNELKQRLATRPAHVIHLAGFDATQAIDHLGNGKDKLPLASITRFVVAAAVEGYVLAGERGDLEPLGSDALAALVCSGQPPPTLVTCNLYNSGYRMAQAMVAAGARAAIGFQDTFDDQLAEEFFATFFRAWRAAKWSSIVAFEYAWATIRARKVALQGSGIVLWTIDKLEDATLIDEQTIRAETKTPVELDADNVRQHLQVDITPLDELNYSILHNNGPLFEEFVIRKANPNLGEVMGLEVNVELHVGTDTYPFRTTASMSYSEQQCDLSHDVRVSLASTLNRALRESVRTSLFTEIRWNDVTLHRRTYRVTLLSVDEWRDDDVNRKWLPSFVLPRDPVVPQIIDRAQKYLMALLDDSTAGFDGYQCVGEVDGISPAKACECVDLQVRAIWSALIYDTPLAYINPPPTFTDSSQRLRTPSDILNGKRGTCIDLALLLASCLEYVEIYPAIVLLKTHAFPAYWRHSSYHEKFSEASSVDPRSAPDNASLLRAKTLGQTYSWYFVGPDHYREMMGAVQAGKLVPLETVALTARAGFGQALAEGYKNLGSRREFDSLLDIQLARTDERGRVTPLPILRTES